MISNRRFAAAFVEGLSQPEQAIIIDPAVMFSGLA
jgi:hypothetical protein